MRGSRGSRLVEGFQTRQTVEDVPASPDVVERGFARRSPRADKDWSRTDRISFVVMTERGLTEALIGDHHFEQAGSRASRR